MRTPTSLSRTWQTQGISLEGASAAANRPSLLLPAIFAKAFRVEGCFEQITWCSLCVGSRGAVRIEPNLDLECSGSRCSGGRIVACWNNHSGNGDGTRPLGGRAAVGEGGDFSDDTVGSDMT